MPRSIGGTVGGTFLLSIIIISMASKYIGRPKIYDCQVMFAMKFEDIEALDTLVLKAGVSRSEYLRFVIGEHLKEKAKESK